MISGAENEDRLLSADEQAMVLSSRPPEIEMLGKTDLEALARRLRNRRDRAQRAASQQKREMRGKADPRGVAPARDNTGTEGKKEVLAAALKRVNDALKKISEPAVEKPAAPSATEVLRKALDAKQAAAPQHPGPGRTSATGMQPHESTRPLVRMDPREVGRVSKATKMAQAKRDH